MKTDSPEMVSRLKSLEASLQFVHRNGLSTLPPVAPEDRSPYVLFVDDEPENLAVFEASCGDTFPVLTATSADEALGLLRSHEIGVLLADQRMPRTTGLQLLERAAVEYPETVRMLITAHSDIGAAIDAINRGRVRRYLRKPWERQELVAALTEALDLYRTLAKLKELERRLLETERVYAVGVIATGLARELRGPAQSMQGTLVEARALLRETIDGSSEDGRDRHRQKLGRVDEMLAESVRGLDRVMDTLRGIEMPTGADSRESVDLNELLRLSLRLLQTGIRLPTGLELDVRTVPKVRGCSSKLAQVVLNLLTNALQAMSKTSSTRKMLSVRLTLEGQWIRLEVSDTGPGIDDSVRPFLFDPLRRRAAAGNSLGMAISKTIIEEMGGRIECETPSSGGACFRVFLPPEPS